MQHVGLMWKARVAILLAMGLGCLPMVAHAETDVMPRVERTPAFDVALTIGPAETKSMDNHDMMMQPQQADQGMAANHWLDVHVTQAGSGAVVSDVTPTIRIVDRSTGESRDLPSVMGMSGGMSTSDFHYGQNVFLPDGTYQISVLLGPADTAQFRDVVVASSAMMAEPAMNGTMGTGHDMSMTDEPGTHP
ncbi:MAG TPA: hypothetical protein VGJ60_31390 [Chloroflexota bacterium]